MTARLPVRDKIELLAIQYNNQLSKTPTSAAIFDSPTLVVVVRRPGCLLCREEVAKLSTFKIRINVSIYFTKKCGVKMVLVFKEHLGTEIYRPEYWKDAMYIDTKKVFYKFLGYYNC
jgi:hypothetical protein